MTAEINKIYVDSGLTVESGYSNTLCFVDGLALDKSRYTLENNEISIYREAKDYLSLFYDTNSSATYYFDKILNEYGIVLFGVDKQEKELVGLRDDNVLIFVDGVLLRKSEYKILDNKNIALFTIKDDMFFHSVVVYVSNITLTHGVLDDPMNIDVGTIDTNPSYPNNSNNKIGYSRENTLIFMNGRYLSPDKIDTVNGYTFVTFTPVAGDKFEYYKLNSNTISVNFEATKGITTYGPVDDFNKKVPNLYDSSATFDDLVKVVVDDLRPGFIICEKDRAGRLLVADTNYETSKIKTITLTPFSSKFYSKDEYYLEVPEAKNIVDYLSDYDKKFTMLPEILRIFQRVVLDEIHDEIERIKNIRNINAVNSDHIYKLLRLLGMDLDIKHLNIKQMQQALDELTEFYRIAGTKKSLNYFNIVQDNTKLINIKQLYTFHKKRNKKEGDKIYSYSYNVYNNGETTFGGSGYEVGEKYKIINDNGEDTGIIIEVTETGPNGSIIDGGFTVNLHEGKKPYSILPLNITTNSTGATLDCVSYPYLYDYSNYSVTSESKGFHENDVLVPTDDKYKEFEVTVDTVNGEGEILTAHINKTSGTKSYDEVGNILLQPKSAGDNLQLVINAKTESYEEVYRTYNAGSGSFTANDSALYRVTFCGAGGAGGAADTAFGSTNDSPAQDGHAGEKKIITIFCAKDQKIDFQIGSGGKPSVAMAGGTCKYGEAGTGSTQLKDGKNGNGEKGKNKSDQMTGSKRHRTFHSDYYCYLLHGSHYHSSHHQRSSVAASGSGGGGSSVTCGGQTWFAAGGNGGDATWLQNGHISYGEVMTGGKGGYGGSTATNGSIELYCWVDETTRQNLIYLKTGTPTIGTPVYNEDGTAEIGRIETISADGKRFYLQGQPTTPYTRWPKGDRGVGARGGRRNIDDSQFTSTAGEDGYIIIERITQRYNENPELRNNHDIYVDPGTQLQTLDGRFTITVDEVDASHKINTFRVTPQTGTTNPIYKIDSSGKMTFTSDPYDIVGITKEAYLNISQTVSMYKYSLNINGSNGAYKSGQTLICDYDEDHTFTITTQNVVDGTIQSYEDGGFDFMPKQGVDNLNFQTALLTTVQGGGAKIAVTSTADVENQNIEREYVDFYLPEEQGAEWKKEYRYPIIDYGYVYQGSPGSPNPWAPENPDIDYGLVSEGSPNAPYPNNIYGTDTVVIPDAAVSPEYDITKTITTKGPIGNPDIDYGLVSEKIKGQWVEWLEWDRPADLYPTNHVEVEVNILSVEDYDQAITRFYKQFYSLASTVLYIHRLVTVYNFGNNTAANITEDATDTSGNMILMGFMTAQPFDDQVYTLTNDPNRQEPYGQTI